MSWIAFLLILAIALVGVGLLVEGLRWLLIIGLVAFVTGGLVGWSRKNLLRGSRV
ncbi:MAG: hypothetical protein ACRDWS_15005 [Acidimicrobiia bacterium]